MDYRYWNAKAALFRALGRVEGVLGGLDPRARTILDRAVPDMEEMVKSVALSALDDFEYKGRTLREWADLVSSGKLVEVAHGSLEDLPMTNADKIRAMSDVELAVFLSDDDRACPPKHPNCHKYVNNCSGCHLEWLQQPAEVPV